MYGDSKYFENETLQPVCRLLRDYSDRKLEEELPDEVLLDYHIAKEPQKLCVKGNAVIHISGKEVDISGFAEGVEFLASELTHIQSVRINAPKFMTIENRNVLSQISFGSRCHLLSGRVYQPLSERFY